MTRTVRLRQPRKPAPEQLAASKQFDIPYFAHMQLDPDHFPHGELNEMIESTSCAAIPLIHSCVLASDSSQSLLTLSIQRP